MKAGKQVAQIPLGWLNGDKKTAAKILLQTMERLMKDSFTKAFVFFLRHYKGALPQVVGGGGGGPGCGVRDCSPREKLSPAKQNPFPLCTCKKELPAGFRALGQQHQGRDHVRDGGGPRVGPRGDAGEEAAGQCRGAVVFQWL